MGRRGDIEAGSAYVRLYMKQTAFDRSVRTLKRKLRTIGQSFTRIGATATAAGTALAGAITTAAKSFAGFGDSLDKMAARTGASVAFLSELKFASEQSGTSIDQLGAAMFRARRRIANAATDTGPAVRALDELKVSAEALSKLDTESQFFALVDALGRVENEGRRAQMGFEIFGDNFRELAPLLNQGTAAIEKLRGEARELNLVMSDADVAAAAGLTDAMNRALKAMEAAWLRVGAAVAPVLTDISNRVAKAAVDAGNWIKANRETVVTVLKVGATAAAVGTALVAFGQVANGAAVAVGALATSMKFLAAHPAVAVAAALGAVYVATVRLTTHTAQLSSEMDRAINKGDQLRATEQARFRQLMALAEKQRLTNSELATAKTIVAELSKVYGDLGIRINETTQSIRGMAGAQLRLNELQRDAAKTDLKAKIAEQQFNIQELIKSRNADANLLFPHEYLNEEDDLAAQQKQIDIEMQKLGALVKRYGALTGGDVSAVTGGATPDRPATGFDFDADAFSKDTSADDAARMNERILDQLADYRISRIEDEQARAIASINKRYAAERAKAKELGADLRLVEKARRAAIENVQRDFSAQRIEDTKQQEEMRKVNAQTTKDEIRRLKIQTDFTGLEKTKRLLAHEGALELRGAESKEHRQAIMEKYQLEWGLAKQDYSKQTKEASGVGPFGTFSTAAALAMSGGGAGGGTIGAITRLEKAVVGVLRNIEGLSEQQINKIERMFAYD